MVSPGAGPRASRGVDDFASIFGQEDRSRFRCPISAPGGDRGSGFSGSGPVSRKMLGVR